MTMRGVVQGAWGLVLNMVIILFLFYLSVFFLFYGYVHVGMWLAELNSRVLVCIWSSVNFSLLTSWTPLNDQNTFIPYSMLWLWIFLVWLWIGCSYHFGYCVSAWVSISFVPRKMCYAVLCPFPVLNLRSLEYGQVWFMWVSLLRQSLSCSQYITTSSGSLSMAWYLSADIYIRLHKSYYLLGW